MRNDTLRFQSDDKSLDHVVEIRNFFQTQHWDMTLLHNIGHNLTKMKHESNILHTPLIPISEKPVN